MHTSLTVKVMIYVLTNSLKFSYKSIIKKENIISNILPCSEIDEYYY